MMTPDKFKSWRKAMGLKRKEIAALLGIKMRTLRSYEKVSAHKNSIPIPKAIQLACYALSRGVSEFDGNIAKNSFNGLGASEHIEMMKPKDSIKANKGKVKA
jgi:transcriptional regulator with XRE-family HTH domain